MAWLRIALTDEELRTLTENRETHPTPLVRRRLLVLWSLHCGLSRARAAQVADVSVATAQRIVSLYRREGLEGLMKDGRTYVPVSDMAQFDSAIRESLEQRPVRSIAEACARIEELTGLKRGPTQVRRFLAKLGLKWQRVRAIPVPPKKVCLSM